jgi:TPR repeat protein
MSTDGNNRRRLQRELFCPPEASKLLEVLDQHGVERFLAELGREAEIGSKWATSTLAYVHLMGIRAGRSDCRTAIAVCNDVAVQGYAYGQYVLAWALREAGSGEEALKWMRAAARQNFLPALIGIGQFVVAGIGLRGHDPDSGMELFRIAGARGHKAAMAFRCGVVISLGGLKGLFASLFWRPVAIAYYSICFAFSPGSESVVFRVAS